ncbi:MAG: hypothetical protein J0H12_00605 [Candidatus Paracaedimonas acanthamoebae]|uniref:Protein-L-isoaspartate O-methyltransferase n=1 Tax=Candidatus Paracaedimonas acanthamoebae TaxID=244581 RepID=A0A8J7PZI4_9PROT|nr:hypothetical protein [Candidatus Paracaedimonas acanthamoebae]
MTTIFEEMRQTMIQRQMVPQYVTHPKILQSFKILQREIFVPQEQRSVCYGDTYIAVAENRLMLAPVMLATLIQAAHIFPHEKVLALACSTGYAAIVLSYLAEKVIAIESSSIYVNQMNEAFENNEIFNAQSYLRPLREGCLEQAPYDVIFIEGSVEEIPGEIFAQLAEGGRIVTILSKGKQEPCQGVVIEKREGSLFTNVLFETKIPILKEFHLTKGFEF